MEFLDHGEAAETRTVSDGCDERLCRICLGEVADADGEPDSWGELDEDLRYTAPCACRGSSKFVHLTCLRKHFEARGEWYNFTCQTCKQPYTGQALMYLAETSKDKMIAQKGPNTLAVACSLHHLARAHSQLGNVQVSKQLLEQALAIKERHYGVGHANTFATLSNLAAAHGRLGDVQKKKAFLEEALAIKEHHYGGSHIMMATTLNNLALAHGELGDLCMKQRLLEESLHIKKLHLGAGHAAVAATLSNLAVTYGELGDLPAKRQLLEQSLAISERHFGAGHIKTATTLHNLALAQGELGDALQSKDLLEQSLQIQEGHFGAHHWELCLTLASLGIAYGTLRDHPSAAAVCGRALRVCRGDWGTAPSSQVFGLTLLRVATVEYARGKVPRAEEFCARGFAKMREALGLAARFRVAVKGGRMAQIWAAAGLHDVATWVETTLLRMDSEASWTGYAPCNSPTHSGAD
mmetsp:Transcript_64177/g.180640  ORF Transcript_64177/g.180640 Transcript_64177/m.180640 type:complete len:466 (-) Transcript_64177:25-1422(-)